MMSCSLILRQHRFCILFFMNRRNHPNGWTPAAINNWSRPRRSGWWPQVYARSAESVQFTGWLLQTNGGHQWTVDIHERRLHSGKHIYIDIHWALSSRWYVVHIATDLLHWPLRLSRKVLIFKNNLVSKIDHLRLLWLKCPRSIMYTLSLISIYSRNIKYIAIIMLVLIIAGFWIYSLSIRG